MPTGKAIHRTATVRHAPKKTLRRAKPIAARTAKIKKPAIARSRGTASELKHREKKYAELFGPSLPKGKGLNAEGEPIQAAEFAEKGWTILQFPPRPGRLSWIYATHGLSTAVAKGKERPTRMELVMHWRDKDILPLKILTAAAKYVLESGNMLASGQIISGDEGIGADVELVRHCLACDPEPTIPRHVELPSGVIQPLVLMGISDAEFEYAMKVRPDLADGRLVLMEALRTGGVFPVTDPKRQCLTRRRDFMRIWENAFRYVRERRPT
ncbi:MAG TPA: suppressor of fused domain protein [Planctomycetota bacterium]|nr:suppressor of fused domain protein [Planctomycetota bacterium]